MTITITALLEAVPPGAVVTNQASVAYDADVNGSNETTVVSDNPDTATPGDPTSFVVGANIAGIPTTSQWGLLLLALSMACLAALRMR